MFVFSSSLSSSSLPSFLEVADEDIEDVVTIDFSLIASPDNMMFSKNDDDDAELLPLPLTLPLVLTILYVVLLPTNCSYLFVGASSVLKTASFASISPPLCASVTTAAVPTKAHVSYCLFIVLLLCFLPLESLIFNNISIGKCFIFSKIYLDIVVVSSPVCVYRCSSRKRIKGVCISFTSPNTFSSPPFPDAGDDVLIEDADDSSRFAFPKYNLALFEQTTDRRHVATILRLKEDDDEYHEHD